MAKALRIRRFAVLGHSGGAPHALACAALLGDRVLAAVGASGLAPRDADGLDWYAGMAPGSADPLHAAERGRAAKEAFERTNTATDPGFSLGDWAVLAGPWGWFGTVVEAGVAGGPGGLIDDDLAFVAPWGFDPAGIRVPVLLLHGDSDEVVPPAHARWLESRIPGAELRTALGDGHVSVLQDGGPAALEWLAGHAPPPR